MAFAADDDMVMHRDPEQATGLVGAAVADQVVGIRRLRTSR